MNQLALFPVLFLFIFASSSTYAKQEHWYKGIVFLNSNESLKGEIQFDQDLNLIQLKKDEKIKVFTPMQVKLFQYYDTKTASNKVYTAISEIKAENWHTKKFYEIVLTGNISVLRTNEHISVKEIPVSFTENPTIKTRQFHYVEQIKHEYYLLYKNKLIKLENFKKDILPLVGLSKKELRKFLTENEMSLKTRSEQLNFIEHFNKLNRSTSLSLL